MRIGDRVLLIVAMLLGIAVCGYLFAVLWGLLPLQGLVQVLYNIADAWYYRIGVTALLALLCMGFVKLLFVRAGSQRFFQEGIAINQTGDVRISAEAIKQLCEQIAKSDPHIESAVCSVFRIKKALVIEIKANCKSELYIPTIAETLQSQITQTLKESCGIQNVQVRVLVEKADVPPIVKAGTAFVKIPNEQSPAQNAGSDPTGTNGGQANG